MKRFLPLWLLLALSVSALSLAVPDSPGTAEEPAPAARDLDELIRQLGDQKPTVRDEATRRLLERNDAVPALRQALQSDDAEVRRRAAFILEERDRRADEQALTRLEALAKDGAIDEAVELLVRRPKWADEAACWQVMTGLAERLLELARKEFDDRALVARARGLPSGDFRQWAAQTKPDLVQTRVVTRDPKKTRDGCFVVRAEDISVKGMSSCNLLVSAGPVHANDTLSGCVIFAGGPVEVAYSRLSGDIVNSVIVCDGDFTVRNSAGGCLIIARGDVRCGGTVQGARIIATGTVHYPTQPVRQDVKVKEKEAVPLGFVKFFDPARAGVSVETAEKELRVKEVAEGKPFARAGLRPGDVVLALDGKAVESPEAFRRLLRAKVALAEDAVFKVRRGEKTLELAVRCRE